MTNLDAMCQLTFDRHQERLAQAARRRLLPGGLQAHVTKAPAWSWRVSVAVAHREISVDQALHLLDGSNGHRSAIV